MKDPKRDFYGIGNRFCNGTFEARDVACVRNAGFLKKGERQRCGKNRYLLNVDRCKTLVRGGVNVRLKQESIPNLEREELEKMMSLILKKHSPSKNNKKATPKGGLVQINSSKGRESVFLNLRI